MATVTQAYSIDPTQALQALSDVQRAMVRHNAMLETVTKQTGGYNAVSGIQYQTVTNVTRAGQKYVTVLRDMGLGYEVYSARVASATNAERKHAIEIERQRALSDRLAKEFIGRTGGRDRTVTTGVIAQDPKKMGDPKANWDRFTTAQAAAAAAGNFFHASQTAAFQGVVQRGNRAHDAVQKLKAITDSAKVKFDELGKITFATAIYRGISLIQLGLTQGVKSAVEFSRQIGLIQTLAKDGTDSYTTWGDAIRKTADAVGMPVAQIAEATYDALSNQVINTSKDVSGLVQVSAELAKVTNANVPDALNVLSSVINTYGKEAGSAQQISDDLFTTVDLGRVRINELNGVIGRSASIAKTAGVSFRELNAGMIVLTQSGLDSAESATLLNNVYSQLIKPNDALAAQFKKMGFESGTAAVKTLGFAGVMRTLAEESKLSSDGIALFFPEIRGLRGAATFAGEGIDKFESSLKSLEESMGATSRASKIMQENLGQSLIDETNRIKNFFTVDIGEKALSAVAGITQMLGGMENIVGTLTYTLGTFVTVAAVAFAGTSLIKYSKLLVTVIDGFGAMWRATTALSAAQVVFGDKVTQSSLKIAGGIGLAVAAGVALYAIMRQIESAAQAGAKHIADNLADRLEAIKKELDNETQTSLNAYTKMTDDRIKLHGQFVAEQKKQNNSLIENSKKSGGLIADNLKNAFQVWSTIAKQGINTLEEAQRKAAENSKRITKDQVKIGMEFEEKQFNRKISFYEKVREQDEASGRVRGYNDPIENIIKMTKQRNDLLRGKEQAAINTGNLDEAKKYLDDILSNLEKLDSYTDKNGMQLISGMRKTSQAERDQYLNSFDSQLPSNYAKEGNREMAFYLQATERLQALNVAREVSLAKQIRYEKMQVKNIDDLLAKTGTFVTKEVFDSKGDLSEKYKDDPSKAVKELAAQQQAALAAAKSVRNITDPIVLVQYNAALKEIEESFGKQRANLALRLEQAQADIALTKAGQKLVEVTTAQRTSLADASAGVKELKVQYESLYAALGSMNQGLRLQIDNTWMQSSSFLSRFNPMVGGGYWSGFDAEAKKHMESLSQDLHNALSKPVGQRDFAGARTAIDAMSGIVQEKGKGLMMLDPTDKEGGQIDMRLAMGKIKANMVAMQRLDAQIAPKDAQIKDAIQQSKNLDLMLQFSISQATPGLDALKIKTDAIIEQRGGVGEAAKGFKELGTSLQDYNNIVKELQTNVPILQPSIGGSVGGKPSYKAGGGFVGNDGGFLMDFLSGKYARGTDTIPAMLTKGEFVVRAPMAERYYSQLVAMNAGQAPIYRAQGGPVSNTSVGDIHITVPGGNGPSVRDFASQLRRGIKAGTVRIN